MPVCPKYCSMLAYVHMSYNDSPLTVCVALYVYVLAIVGMFTDVDYVAPMLAILICWANNVCASGSVSVPVGGPSSWKLLKTSD
jgi:hypothetical protein